MYTNPYSDIPEASGRLLVAATSKESANFMLIEQILDLIAEVISFFFNHQNVSFILSINF